MAASYNSVFVQGQYWRLWTTLFAHADVGHLLSNSLLFSFSDIFFQVISECGFFPIAALFMGGITNALVLPTYDPVVNLIGVSGVVYWMGGAWLTLYLLLDQQRSYLQRSLRSIGVALAVFMPSAAFDPQVSYRTHLVGFFIGVVFGAIYYFFRRSTFEESHHH